MRISREHVKFDDTDENIKLVCITTKGDILFVRNAKHLKGYELRCVYVRDVQYVNMPEVRRAIMPTLCANGGVVITGDSIEEVR